MERDVDHIHAARFDVEPLFLSKEGPLCDEHKGGHVQRAAELEVEVVHQDIVSIDHEPGLVHDQQALPGLHGQQVSRQVGIKPQRRRRVRVAAVALHIHI